MSQANQLRRTTLVEDYHPIVRRRAITSIRTSLPSYLTDFFDNIKQEEYYQGLQKSQKIILDHFNRIHQIIDVVDDHIRRRIQCYQNQVVNVVQKQIQQMREQTHHVVEQFNIMINQKNKENQIYSLNNQLDYFKSQAKKLFDSNRKLRQDNKELKRINQEYVWELQNKEVVMQKIHMRYLKEKYYKQKLYKQINQSKLQMEASQQEGKLKVKQYSKELDKQIKSKKISKEETGFLLKQSSTIKTNKSQADKLNLNVYRLQQNEKNNHINLNLNSQPQQEQKLGESIAMMNQFTKKFSIQHYTQSKYIADMPENSRIQLNFQEEDESDYHIGNFNIISPGISQSINQHKFNQHLLQSKRQNIIKVDQACQANIYLSQSDYRQYFKKNDSSSFSKDVANSQQKVYSPKQRIKQISQIQVQTDTINIDIIGIDPSYYNHPLKSQAKTFDDTNQRLATFENINRNRKEIDFVRNGFFVNDISQINKRYMDPSSKSKSKQKYDHCQKHIREHLSSGDLFNNQARGQHNSFGSPQTRNQNRSMGKKLSSQKDKQRNVTEMNYYNRNSSPQNAKAPNLNFININIINNPQKSKNEQSNNNCADKANTRYLGKQKKQKRENTKMLMKFQNSKIRSRQFRNLASKSVLN